MEDNFGHPLHSTRPPPSSKSELNSGPLCSPGTVPFGWEKTPGMPKLPAPNGSRDSSFGDCITEEEDPPTTATSTCLEDDDEDDDDGDGGVVYSDAPEELSRTESFFFNCSLGGISGFEECADARRPLGIMSCDPKVQDLMMGRFLPAAQAMAAETPTHVGRKQTTRVEETPHVSRVRDAPAQLRYWECRPDLSPNYAPELYIGVETDDEDRDSSILEDRPMRGCWFLARFCIKAPFRITNGDPAPDLKAAYHINKVGNASSNEPFNTWLKQKYASPARSLKVKICDLGWSSSKGSTSLILENPPLATKVPMHCSRPRFSTDGGRTVASGTDTKMINDHLEKPSTSFRDLLAQENKEWNSRSNYPPVEKNPYGRTKDETDHRNPAVIHPIFSARNPDHSSRQQGKVESSKNRTPTRAGGKQESSRGQCANILLSPPLPDSPSESWLVRTLPFTPSPRRRPPPDLNSGIV